jgi:hypothetical protein
MATPSAGMAAVVRVQKKSTGREPVALQPQAVSVMIFVGMVKE